LLNPGLRKTTELLGWVVMKEAKVFSTRIDGVLRFRKMACVLEYYELKRMILDKEHKSRLIMRFDMSKIYQTKKRTKS